MPSKHYSKEVQVELLDEIADNQGTTNTIVRNDSIREWNYFFLLRQELFRQKHTGVSGSEMLVGEELTEAGKVWRTELYERLQREQEESKRYQEQQQIRQKSTGIQTGLWWMTLAILGLTALLAIRQFFCQ